MKIAERLEIVSDIEKLCGMLSIFSDIIKADCNLRDDQGLEIFREYAFDEMYNLIENIRRIAIKPFPNFEGYTL